MDILSIHFHAGVEGFKVIGYCGKCGVKILDDDFIELWVSQGKTTILFTYHLRCVDVFGAVDVLSKIST